MGPNIYGFYYTPAEPLRDVLHRLRRQGPRGAVVAVGRHRHGDHRLLALGQDGRVGDRRPRQQVRHRRGRPADLLRAGRRTRTIIAQHCEDLKDGRAFAEVAKRVSKKKPVDRAQGRPHSAGRARRRARTPARSPATTRSTRTCCKQSGVIRARSLRDLLEFARGVPMLPTPKGENVVIITGAGGSGVLLSDACVDNGLHADGDAAGPRRGVPQVHPAVRRRRQPGRHHRRRAAEDLPEHGPARPRGRRASTR